MTTYPNTSTDVKEIKTDHRQDNSAVPRILTGAEIFVEALKEEGVDTVFGYPGGVVLSIYDKLFHENKIKHILIRHEQGGTHEADGYARVTGKPGVVLVTSGPGATNTVTGIATAFADSIPLVVFTGQVATSVIGNEAFQEADTVGITRPITKHSFLVTRVEDLAETIHKAFYLATTGRPGPVVVDLPKDVILAKTEYVPVKHKINLRGYKPTLRGSIPQIKKAAEFIQEARRPVLYVGGGVIRGEAWEELTALARKTRIPVTTTLMGLGAFPESDELSLGMLGMHGTWYANMAVSECDLLIAIGARFDDRVTGKTDEFATKARVIHIDIDPVCISRNVPVDVPIVGHVKYVLKDLLEFIEPGDTTEWLKIIDQWKKEHPLRYNRTNGFKPQRVIELVSEMTRGNAIITNDVGQHQMWTAQYYKFNKPRHYVSSGGLGTMGFGFPAAVGAAIARPEETVVAIVGDGGFQMTFMELATAVKYKVPVKVVVINNGYLGMVRQWQELFFEKRYSHVYLEDATPDFVKLAESFGAVGFRAEDENSFRSAFEKAIQINDRPVVIDAVVTKEENVYPMVAPGKPIYDMIEGDDQ